MARPSAQRQIRLRANGEECAEAARRQLVKKSIGELLLLGEALAEHCWTGHPRAPAESDWAARSASTVRIRSIDGDAGNRATASMRRSSRTCRPGDGFNCSAAAG